MHKRRLGVRCVAIVLCIEVQATAAAVAAPMGDLRQENNEAKPAAQSAPRVSMAEGRPTISSADGHTTWSPRTLVQLDSAGYQQDEDGGAETDFRRGSVGESGNRETDAARDLSDSVYFRRARLGFEGSVARDFNYRLMVELGGAGTEGPTRINDAWIAYAGLAPFTIQLGAFSPMANMDDSTSVESSVFIERASPAELSRALAGADGRIGLGLRGNGPKWMSSLALTSRTVSDAEVSDAQLAGVARLGMLAATSPDYNVHAGVSGTWVFQPPDHGSSTAPRYPLRFRDRPEMRADSTRLIDTGNIEADSGYAGAVELGANWKNWYLQSERFWYGIDRPGSPDPNFGGFYVQGSWFVTGERRAYDAANGSFHAPHPRAPFSGEGGVGAWEVALRYSRTDLNCREGAAGTVAPIGSVRGGDQQIWTLGLNWYLNARVRLLVNYLHIDVDRLNPAGPANPTPFGPAPATPPSGVQIGQELHVFALRTQFSF